MAKAAILDVLENTIGKYVQNLDAESLNVAVWAGKIELKNLKLDVEAVNRELARKAAEAPNLALPFRVVNGSFSHLQVDVPWARITSRPVVMRLGGLNATFEPYDHLASKYDKDIAAVTNATANNKIDEHGNIDEELMTPTKKKKKKKDERAISLTYAEEGRHRANTVRRLAEVEEEEEMSSGSSSGVDKSEEQTRGSSSKGFKARLVRRIIENLQIDIDGVRLEMRGQGCVAGVVLDHFSIVTTDKDGTRTFVDRATNSSNVEKSFIYKVLQLQGLAIYCDEESSYSKHKIGSQRYKPLTERQRGERNYILSPLSFEAKLRQSDCLNCIDFPKYLLSTRLPSVNIRLSRTQLELMNKVSRDILKKKHVSRPLFPEYRPTEPLTRKNAKIWWKYAVRSIGRITRKRSWTEFYIAFQKRKEYISLYKRLASDSCSWIHPLTDDEHLRIKEIEMDKTIGVQGIMNWRNIADAQVELETRKYEAMEASRIVIKPSSRKRFFAFGSSKDDKSVNSTMSTDDAPITLSLSELKELENDALAEYSTDDQISSDSILCDIEFHLGSFEVDLITFASRPLASIQMGTLSSSFKANADGSFLSDFQMSSFNISDRITPKTLFPYVVRSLEQTSESDSADTFQDAFGFTLKKAKNGDQNLEARLVSFEIVACSMLISEFKKFVSFTAEHYNTYEKSAQNPSLEYSVTGGADLFYDANDPTTESVIKHDNEDFIDKPTRNRGKVSGKLASAFNDAWNSKLEKKIAWQVQLDIRAPIIVLPQSSIDPMSTVLVADLGTFRFAYGGGDLAEDVQRWFDSNSNGEEVTIDRCSLEMDDFKFLIGKAANKDWLKSTITEGESTLSSEALIEPITFSIDIGIENGGARRKCIVGVLPSISLKISYSHIVRIMSVVSSWLAFSNSLIGTNEKSSPAEGVEILCENIEEEGEQTSARTEESEEGQVNKAQVVTSSEIHLSFALQRLSFQITNDDAESVEAHLISVVFSSTKQIDGSSTSRLCMGYFWILDHLKSDFPRRQRLVAHSCLPLPASSYAENNCYDILNDLERQGVFEETVNNNSLADVTIMKSPHFLNSLSTEDSEIVQHAKKHSVTKIDAKFSTLFIHWNPYTIRNLLKFKADVTGFLEKLQARTAHDKVGKSKGRNIERSDDTRTLLILNAEMEAFEIYLNSAKDDMPLFMMKMCDAKIRLHASKDTEENLKADVSLGDFRLEVPTKTKILREYSTILGLSSSFSSSLLCLEYGKGPLALQHSTLEYLDRENTEMFIDVSLSPMRFVYVQSQIFTLIEYVTEGLLGALTQRVASSAAQAAYDIAQTESIGKKIFFVKASGIDFVLPQAAYSPENLALHIGNMSVRFTAFPTPGDGAATVALDEVTMKCNQEESIIEAPIRMAIDVKLAPLTAPTLDDQATRIMVSISRAEFILTRRHYAQIMKTLETNIGEVNSFLRDEQDMRNSQEQNISKKSISANRTFVLTHGGAEEVIVKKRMYMTFKFQELILELCDETSVDAILSINAVETTILVRLFPDDETMWVDATLHDLVVEDRRLVTLNRHFRKLVRQVADSTNKSDSDVFKLKYFQSKKTLDQSIDIGLGRPQIVFIPDLVAHALAFFKKDDPPATIEVSLDQEPSGSIDNIEVLEESSATDINTHKKKTLIFKLSTADCRLVLIDYGTTTSSDVLSSKSAEAIVLQGETEAKAELVSEVNTGTLVKSTVEIHGEKFEVYTAEGENLMSPVQVMNPIRFSAFLSTKMKNHNQLIDISFVTLSSLRMTLSMQNYALLTAIVSSTSEAWSHQNKDLCKGNASISLPEEKPLSKGVVEQIQKVSTALARADSEVESTTTGVEVVFRDSVSAAPSSSHTTLSQVRKRLVSIKMTLPETVLTVVNDLQGLDDALFKISIYSCVWGGDASLDDTVKDNTLFHIHTNANIQADYFDSHTKLWEPLLLKPWEIDFKASRGKKKGTSRMTTTLDLESHPCQVSFSEQLIISLQGAASMWSLYSETTRKALEILDKVNQDEHSLSFMKARASYSARAMTTTMPYGIENRTGFTFMFDAKDGEKVACHDTTTFFNFALPQGEGIGGCRSYGQDGILDKAIDIFFDGGSIHIDHVDDKLNKPKKAHKLKDGQFIFSEVFKSGKSTIIQVTSFMNVHNETNLKFSVSLKIENDVEYVGVCASKQSSCSQRSSQPCQSSTLGIPTTLLQKAYNNDYIGENVILQLSNDKRNTLVGEIQLPPFPAYYKIAEGKSPMKTFEMVCSSALTNSKSERRDRMVLKIGCVVTVVDHLPFVEFFVQPRMLLQNNMCINIFAKTPMSHIYKKGNAGDISPSERATVHRLEPFESLEIYAPEKSVAFTFKCADIPVGDIKTGWNKPGWVEIPLSVTAKLKEKVNCYFPFVKKSREESTPQGGSSFFIAEVSTVDSSNIQASTSKFSPTMRVTTLNIENLGVDHTGDFLFEDCGNSQSFILSSFSSSFQKRRITLLPGYKKLIRILQLSTGRRSLPFRIDDIAFANGGINSTSIQWRDSTESGFYAYKRLSFNNESETHSHNQLEIHIIPAIIIYNGGNHCARVIYSHGQDMILEKGKMSPVHQSFGEKGINLLVEIIELGCVTTPLTISKTGLLVSVMKSTATGAPVGSIAIQTIIGTQDSRYVIKIGPMKHGNVAGLSSTDLPTTSFFGNDLLRFRVRWSQMEVMFLDTSKHRDNNENDLELEISENSNKFIKKKSTSYAKVAHLDLNRFTVDFQRVFKDDVVSVTMQKRGQARTQFAIIIQDFNLVDCTQVESGTTVLASISKATNFFELCIRTRDVGEVSGVTSVDLLELKLANSGKVIDKIILNTDEAFLWSLLDIASRTKDASVAFEAIDTDIQWNDDTESFNVKPIYSPVKQVDESDDDGNYSAPRSDALYAIKKACVLPTSFLVSFKRQPQASRYQKLQNVKGAKIVDYFTKKLNFTVDSAKLRFSGFQVNNVKGPPSRIIELVKAFYSSQMKTKIFTLLTATSIDEWHQLAGRDEGAKGYIEGDLLRTAGNLTGKSAGYLVKKVGQGIGFGLTAGTAEVGNGIQNMTEAIGVGAVGAGVNSVISGLGDGVGSTVQGVGDGGSKIIKGAGKGVGQIVGGVGGGIILASKGVGKAVTSGDGKAAITGIGDGAVSIGNGIIKGGESVVTGVGDGVFAVGKGLFSGVKSVGMGLGGMVTGRPPSRKAPKKPRSRTPTRRNRKL